MESETPLHARKRSTGIQITDTSFFLSMERKNDASVTFRGGSGESFWRIEADSDLDAQ